LIDPLPAIGEPATLVTDYLMAGIALVFSIDLARRADGQGHVVWWSRAFGLLAAGAFLGGSWHGFHEWLPLSIAGAFWWSTLASTALASFAFMRASALQWLAPGRDELWAWIAGIKLAAVLAAQSMRPDFLVSVLDFAASALFLTVAAGLGRRRQPAAFAFVVAGVGLFAVGVVVQQGGVSPHRRFNHNDLFHVIQGAANACFFLSARPPRETEKGPT
jgi:hypothetical protein